MRYIETSPISQEMRDSLKVRIDLFVARWMAVLSLVELGDCPIGDGGVSDIRALDYIVYEDLYHLVGDDKRDFFAVASAVFGNCLVRFLKFEWCMLDLPSGPTLGLVNADNNQRIAIEGMVAEKLSGDPQFDCFEDLLLDVFLSRHYWPMGCHPIVEIHHTPPNDCYENHWNFKVPLDIDARFNIACYQDEGRTIRALGLTAYDWITVPDWAAMRSALDNLERQFDEDFSPVWRALCQEKHQKFNAVDDDFAALVHMRLV